MELPFTSLTEEERNDNLRMAYMHTVVNYLAAAIFVGTIPVTFHLTSLIAMERESGMSQLIDCIMPNIPRWQPQAARILAAHLALDVVYGPGLIIIGIVLKICAFNRTSLGITVVNQVLTGLSLCSFSIFTAAFFKKAQLSGIAALTFCLFLAVITQFVTVVGNGAVMILSLIFPPMNYVYFTMLMARWEGQNRATDLYRAAPESPWTVSGIVFWVFLVVQIFVYPFLGALVERFVAGAVRGWWSTIQADEVGSSPAVTVDRLVKVYEPSRLSRIMSSIFGIRTQHQVLAVDDLSLNVDSGQIVVLLGANGSGKSTVLDAISGLTRVTDGQVRLNYGGRNGSFGHCPQRNVLWDSLTVSEHVTIFGKLKVVDDEQLSMSRLIEDCDLADKADAYGGTLSGGQRRKLQLAMMFAGGSTICCVDEVSSGLDPVSRRKIWDIILAERERRTILLTTHFLDEADLLADRIVILYKGSLKAQGSSVELKNRLGEGYRIRVRNDASADHLKIDGIIPEQISHEETVYVVKSSAGAARLVAILDCAGARYHVNGPTLEDAFLKVIDQADSDEAVPDQFTELSSIEKVDGAQPPRLQPSGHVGLIRQASILFVKRAVVLRRNMLPHLAALAIPVVASGLVTTFLGGIEKNDTCSQNGPPRGISNATYQRSFLLNTETMHQTHVVNSYQELRYYVEHNATTAAPGVLYLGNASTQPTFAWKADRGNLVFPAITQHSLNVLLTGVQVQFQFQVFDVPQLPNVSSILQLMTYFTLSMAVYPALLALYPAMEKLSRVRALHYSSGVSSLPLWLAYLTFDSCTVLVVSVLVIIVFCCASSVWYQMGYLLAVFLLYGVCSTLLAYIVSQFARSQLAAFAFAAGGQCVVYLVYFTAYAAALTYSPAGLMDYYINLAHFTIAAVSPIGNLARSMLITLNVFSVVCRGTEMASYPGELVLYGGPVLYLVLQSFLLSGVLIWSDGRADVALLTRRNPSDASLEDGEALKNSARGPGLHAVHLTKSFGGKNKAVDDVTFSVARGEVFALMGPNGAGKTTTISLIRGETKLSQDGDVFVDNVSMRRHRTLAQRHLGISPQFDAMDDMTVEEHLHFYASIHGVSNVQRNVREMSRTVGLSRSLHLLPKKLSGGNKRKLSLGIALMGNPSVLVLDEPSSGMDAVAKRVMWKTLRSLLPGRSILLTTHSMEEADALATSAGIMAAGCMLAVGTTEYLRQQYGDMYHVHLEHWQAPHTSDDDVEYMRQWVLCMFPGAVLCQNTCNRGQLRFSVSMMALLQSHSECSVDGRGTSDTSIASTRSAYGMLFSWLEKSKRMLGVRYYSVDRTSLDEVLFGILGQYDRGSHGSN